MSFVCCYVASDKKTGATGYLARACKRFAVSSNEREFNAERDVKLNCGQYIPTYLARRQSVDARYLAGQGGVRLVIACNHKSAILLKLLDHRIGDQNFDARHQRVILERGHRNAVNVPKIVRLYRPDVISKATGDREAKDCR